MLNCYTIVDLVNDNSVDIPIERRVLESAD